MSFFFSPHLTCVCFQLLFNCVCVYARVRLQV